MYADYEKVLIVLESKVSDFASASFSSVSQVKGKVTLLEQEREPVVIEDPSDNGLRYDLLKELGKSVWERGALWDVGMSSPLSEVSSILSHLSDFLRARSIGAVADAEKAREKMLYEIGKARGAARTVSQRNF